MEVCTDYAATHYVVFNSNKTKTLYFSSKYLKIRNESVLTVNNQPVRFVKSVTYLGVTITDNLSEDMDIRPRVSSIYCTANMLRSRFFKCSANVTNILFRHFCTCMYGINLWSRYSHSSIEGLRVVYDNRVLHSMPRKIHIRETVVNCALSTFQSLLRKNTRHFILRCFQSSISYLVPTFECDYFLYSHYFAHYSKLNFHDFCQCRSNVLVGRLRPVY